MAAPLRSGRDRSRELHSHRLGSQYVRPEWAAHLERIAVEEGRTINSIVRDAIRDYLQKRGLL